MICFRLCLATVFSLAAMMAAAAPRPEPARHTEARLIAGARDGDALTAGIEINLDPGFKTYWRMPGESGLPPSFDWSGSQNLAEATIAWPAPRRIEDSGGVAYGYEGRIVLPVRVRPVDPAAPVTLALGLDYGVCHDICIPEHARLARTLTGPAPADEATLVVAALAEVPRSQALGAASRPAIVAVERTGPDRIGVTVRAQPGSSASLFVEAPEPWFFLAAANPAQRPGSDLAQFDVQVLQRDPEASGPVPITLTLVAGSAVETRLVLDAGVLAR
jgi:DsbC/DsbD-like thiol-disulfide interchange protein